MENHSPTPYQPASTTNVEWSSMKVYALGAISLLLGVVLGALFHGSAQPIIASEQQMSANSGQVPQRAPDPALEKVQSNPDDFDSLSQAGIAAMKAGNPKLAVGYYGRALKIKDDVGVRTNLGNALFRSGDVDQALEEFAAVLKIDPTNENALYNTGYVRLVAKNDPKGAIASWEMFIKFHPDHPRKALVLQQIERAKKVHSKV